MPAVVDVPVDNPQEAAQYYESLMAVTPAATSPGAATLVGDHLTLKLTKAAGAAPGQTTLQVTPGMLARVLDMAMHTKCRITVNSAEEVQFADKYGRQWILRCRIS